MFCRKCGTQLSDDSTFCHKCGERIIEIDGSTANEYKSKTESQIYDDYSSTIDVTTEGINIPSSSFRNKVFLAIGIIIAIVVCFVLITKGINNAKRCDFGSCENNKIENSDYCYEHTCSFKECYWFKGTDDRYCYSHRIELCCEEEDCDSTKVNGGTYCTSHTCEKTGCFERRYLNTNYCLTHQVNMRDNLIDSSFYFNLNSAGGIVFNFKATNATSKEIKYVRFNVGLYNAVGDRAYDEITDEHEVSVEIIGPVKPRGTIELSKEIIGYCDNCAKVEIRNITLIYSDGSSETGRFNYYYEKP